MWFRHVSTFSYGNILTSQTANRGKCNVLTLQFSRVTFFETSVVNVGQALLFDDVVIYFNDLQSAMSVSFCSVAFSMSAVGARRLIGGGMGSTDSSRLFLRPQSLRLKKSGIKTRNTNRKIYKIPKTRRKG